MAKKKPNEYAEEVLGNDDYLKEVLSLIPAEKKEPLLSRLGERIMARDDYSRGMDDLREKETANVAYKSTLDTWFQEKLGDLESGKQAKDELAKVKGAVTPPASDTLKSLEGYIKKDEHQKLLEEKIRASEEAGLNIFTTLTKLGLHHLHEYGEPLDPDAIIAAARKSGKDISSAYTEWSSEKRAAKLKKAEDERLLGLKAKWREEWAKEQGHGVFPVTADPGFASPLEGLKLKPEDKSNRISQAIEDFSKNASTRRAS